MVPQQDSPPLSSDPRAVWLMVAGGGTAGHLTPGLAVAGELLERGHDRDSIVFVGSARGLEARLVPEAGYEAVLLPGRGIQRRLTKDNLGAIKGLIQAFGQAHRLLGERRPQVVLCLGGYASVATALSAVLRRVPVVITEQNARAGLANRLIGRFAKAAAVPFAETDLPRAIVTGNPVRGDILTVDRTRDAKAARDELDLPADRTVISVFSGSLGSRTINEAVLGVLERLADRSDLAIRHVVGERDWDQLEERVPPLPGDGLFYQPVRYESRMDLLYAASDLALTRAGGSTVAELAVVGLPAILVPFPTAPRDHQTANGAALADRGAAVLVADDELTAERLHSLIEELGVPERLAAMSDAAAGLGYPDAAAAVADLVTDHATESPALDNTP